MSCVTGCPEHVERRAAAVTPAGYTLWAVYSSKAEAARTKRLYGHRTDKVKVVPGFAPWAALYGQQA